VINHNLEGRKKQEEKNAGVEDMKKNAALRNVFFEQYNVVG